MATAPSTRDRPHGSANFLVAFGSGARMTSLGIAEVIFPTFVADEGERPAVALLDTSAGIGGAAPARAAGADARVILRRGATGALDLYTWWDQARRGKAPRRRVLEVKLLADDRESVVLAWRFLDVRPVALTYSPLQAMTGAILMETLELAYDDFEMS